MVPAGGYLLVYFANAGAGPPGLYNGFGLGQSGDELHLNDMHTTLAGHLQAFPATSCRART